MIRAVVFDAYGTLFDVNAAARALSSSPEFPEFDAVWQQVSRDWRDKQLGYSWLRAVTGAHTDFWQVTQDALDWALEANGCAEPELREALLALYWELEAFADVPETLGYLREQGKLTAILSNGSNDMLDAAVETAGIADLLDAILSVDAVGIFKPAKAVYDLIGQQFGTRPSDVVFVSSNGWDVAAATGYGFQTIWINRAGVPMDRLPWHPDHIVDTLVEIPEILEKL